MRWMIEIQGETVEVEATRIDEQWVEICYDGTCQKLLASAYGGRFVSVVNAHNQNFVAVAESEARGQTPGRVWLRGHSYRAVVSTPRDYAVREAQQRQHEQAASVDILAPMGGKVVAVLCEDGEAVSAGAGLLVIEAMKMENEVRAPTNGLIRGLTAQVGDVVDAQAVLCSLLRASKK